MCAGSPASQHGHQDHSEGSLGRGPALELHSESDETNGIVAGLLLTASGQRVGLWGSVPLHCANAEQRVMGLPPPPACCGLLGGSCCFPPAVRSSI